MNEKSRKWTPREDEQLRAMCEQGLPSLHMARVLGRTQGSILDRKRDLDIPTAKVNLLKKVMTHTRKNNPRIVISAVKSPWGTISYDLYVDKKYVGNYKYKADAKKIGEAKVSGNWPDINAENKK